VAHDRTPPLPTAAALGKGKLELMFASTAGGQAAPSKTWSPKNAPSSARDPTTGYAFDAATLAGARGLLDDAPAFLLVNLADVDRVSHGAGPHSEEAHATRRETDRVLGAFIADVLRRPEWRDGTLVVTADHGFDATVHPVVDFQAELRAAGLDAALVAVADGGVAHVYARDPGATGGAALAAARRVALSLPGVAEALYRDVNPEDGGDAHVLARVHPEWRLAHPRAGDLLLIAASGYALAESGGDEVRLKGNHGAPAECDVPIIAVGGGAHAGDRCDDVTAADVGRTLLECLGLREVARIDGASIAADARGRALHGLCAAPNAGDGERR
jgi:arylsulfatase A-like enzyme